MRSIAVFASLLLLTPAIGQDRQPAPDDGAQARQQDDQAARRARRAWLVRRLEELRQEQARLEQMVARLDAGEPMPEMRRPMRDREDEARGRPQRGPDARDGEGPMSPEERTRLVFQFAREHFPEFAERLEAERQRDPGAAHRIAARFWPRVVELRELEKSEPELFAVEVERLRSGEAIMTTVRRARAAPPADDAGRQRLMARLRELAERNIELRLEATRLRLESLRASVRDTERELQERQAQREQSVEEQVQRFLRWIERGDRDDDADDRPQRRPERRGG